MGSAALGLRARVIDQGNGVYRIEDVSPCAVMRGGEAVEACDFLEDVVTCMLERLGMDGPASRWSASVVVEGASVVIEAWLPPMEALRERYDSFMQLPCCHH